MALLRAGRPSFDEDRDGTISYAELSLMLKTGNYGFVPPVIAEHIHEISDTNGDGRIDFEEFVAMLKNPRLKNYFQRHLDLYVETIMPSSIIRKRRYHHEFQFWPPPFGMFLISLVEILFFLLDAVLEKGSTENATGPLADLFMYNPYEREQVWRFISYMFIHVGVIHLISNLLVQLMLGIPLEMVHKYWRVLIIYMAGVLAGSLGESIIHSRMKLAGASGGVYALMTAHIATIIMNWSEIKYVTIQFLIFVLIIGCDLGNALYETKYKHMKSDVGHIAHASGALAGLLVGINVLKNLRLTRKENIIWWISLCTYGFLFTLGVVLNIFWTSHFP